MLTKEQFEKGVAYAEKNFRKTNDTHLKLDKKIINSKLQLDGKKILDFGCGMGGMTLWYATNFQCKVDGVDIDAHHIEIAEHVRQKFKVENVNFRLQDILKDPFDPEEMYDIIFLNDVVEHIPIPVLKQIFQQLAMHLNHNGVIFIGYPPWYSPYASHVNQAVKIPWCQFLPEKLLIKLIKKNNIEIIGKEESDLLSVYQGLNHLTYKKLAKILEKCNLKVVYRKTHSIINKLSMVKHINFTFFPFNYLITKEFLILSVKK